MIKICIHHTRHLLHSLILSQKTQNKAFSKPTSSMALAEVGEPPDVTQTHAEAHAGEQVLGFVVPFGPVARLFYLHLLQLRMRGDPVVHARIREFQLHLHSSPFFRQLRWLQKWILAVSDPLGKSSCLFLLLWMCTRRGLSQRLFCELSLSRSFSPTARPWKRGWVIYCDLWHFNRSYQWLMTVLFELCNVSYFKKVQQSLKTVNTLHEAISCYRHSLLALIPTTTSFSWNLCYVFLEKWCKVMWFKHGWNAYSPKIFYPVFLQ